MSNLSPIHALFNVFLFLSFLSLISFFHVDVRYLFIALLCFRPKNSPLNQLMSLSLLPVTVCVFVLFQLQGLLTQCHFVAGVWDVFSSQEAVNFVRLAFSHLGFEVVFSSLYFFCCFFFAFVFVDGC